MSMISGKISDEDDSYKIKKKNNFAYAVHLGAATEFAPGVNGELTYSFRDMGKFKKNKDSTISAPSLKGHHVAAGVRFDL
jgi:opacity protein-like surface antigen